MSNNVDEGKIISKIDKIFKQIDPNSKKQITELSENVEFRKNVEQIRDALQQYIGIPNYPKDVYNKAKDLISFCNNEYKNLMDKKVELEVQAKKNVELSKVLNEVYLFAVTRENFDNYVPTLNENGLEDYVQKLQTIFTADRKSPEYEKEEKAIKSKINNLETNMHIDIDLERITDKEKALTYISIELDNVLARVENCAELIVTVEAADPVVSVDLLEKYVPDHNVYAEYIDDSLVLVKRDLFSRIINSKLVVRIKEMFDNSNVKALNAGITNAKID